MHVSLFVTCFNDTLFPETGIATVRLLERLGHQVDFPEEQTCCGQMHFNTGYRREAIPLAKRFLRVFADAEVVVTPSASCAAMVRELYPRLAELAGDEALTREVESLAPRVLELTEFLVHGSSGACGPTTEGTRPYGSARSVRSNCSASVRRRNSCSSSW